jgi:hypothetical protein
MGLSQDLVTEAAKGLQDSFGNRNLLNKSSLDILAPFVGAEGIRKIMELPSGKVDVLQIMDIIAKPVLNRILTGISPIGEQVGSTQAAAQYNTALNKVNPALAQLIMAYVNDAVQGEDTVRQNNARSMGLTEYYLYNGSQVSPGLVQGSTRDAYASVGKEVTELQAFFKYLRDDFLLTLLPLLADFLREIKSIVINFLPENEKELLWAQTSKRNQQITQSMIEEKHKADQVSNTSLEQFYETDQFSYLVNKSHLSPEKAKEVFRKGLDQRIIDKDYSMPLDFLESFGFDPSADYNNPDNVKKAIKAITDAKTVYARLLGSNVPSVMLGELLRIAATADYKNGHRELASNFIGLSDIAVGDANAGVSVGQGYILGSINANSRDEAFAQAQHDKDVQALAESFGNNGSTAISGDVSLSYNTVMKGVMDFIAARTAKDPSFLSGVNTLDVRVKIDQGDAYVVIANDKGDQLGKVKIPKGEVKTEEQFPITTKALRAGVSGTTSSGPTSSAKQSETKPNVVPSGATHHW